MGTDAFQAAMRRVFERYGLDVESRFVEVGALGGRVHVLVAGDGPPVVMLNGGGTPAAMLAPLMAELSGVRLYAVDLPGFGLTDMPAGFTSDLRASAVGFTTGVVDALGLDRVCVVANSLGSLVTFWTALDAPGRVVASVHLGCPAIILGTSAPLLMRLMSTRLGPVLMKLDPPSARQIERLSKIVREHPLEPEIAELLLETERLAGFAPALLGTYRQLIRLRGARPEMALSEEDLARIDHPVQLIWGEDDPFGGPAVGERAAEAIPEADLHVVPGGHAPWLRSAGAVGGLIRAHLDPRTHPHDVI